MRYAKLRSSRLQEKAFKPQVVKYTVGCLRYQLPFSSVFEGVSSLRLRCSILIVVLPHAVVFIAFLKEGLRYSSVLLPPAPLITGPSICPSGV